MQTDPLGAVDGFNLYAYVGNHPVSWIDPFGLNLLDPVKNWWGRTRVQANAYVELARTQILDEDDWARKVVELQFGSMAALRDTYASFAAVADSTGLISGMQVALMTQGMDSLLDSFPLVK